jgi:predicted nucleic acid-binding protein
VISTASLLEDAASMMGTTGLGSADAVHLAVARSLGAPILTHDRLMIHAARRWPGVLTERSP